MISFFVIFSLACSGSREIPAPKTTAATAPILPEDPVPAMTPAPFKRVKARHILIAHSDSQNAPSNVRRNRFDARLKAQEILHQAQSGHDFTKLAIKHSNDPSAVRGGGLGVFERGIMVDAFEEMVFNLNVDEMAMVETEFGFHIVQRLELIEVNLTHIIVEWKASPNSKTKRSQSKAKERIERAQAALRSGLSPKEVAIQFSDGPFGKRGGDVGWFQKGQLNPILEGKAFTLGVAQISPIIETKLGFHLLIRNQ